MENVSTKKGKLFFPYEDNVDHGIKADVIEKIYDRLKDDISKSIFEKRLMYSLTGDHSYIQDMLELSVRGGRKLKQLLSRKNTNVFIYGAGVKGGRIVKIYKDISFSGFVDQFKTGEYLELPIIKMEQLKKQTEPYLLLVSNTDGYCEIKKKLLRDGVPQENIVVLKELEEETFQNKYFDESCIERKWEDNRFFVDAGCYNGEDVEKFYEWSKSPESEVYAFEPDEENYRICKHVLREHDAVHLMNFGLADKEEVLFFENKGKTDSSFSATGDSRVEVHSLDTVIPLQGCGFLKMDVEGLESKVLLGAKRIIQEAHPILALSIYHKRSDIWTLPELILTICPQYKFYLRHYTFGLTDTVLYGLY